MAVLPQRRFIPAGAGNTRCASPAPQSAPVYPRWRGEHYKVGCRMIWQRGLSPLARGTQKTYLRKDYIKRFIPAGAGNTDVKYPVIDLIAVYPRWRGEHFAAWVNGQNNRGLSPLARGTHIDASESRWGHRFIPAGAGNTCQKYDQRADESVYPRWRGEH